MAASPKRVVWDASAWIALILQEDILTATGIPRGQATRTVIQQAERGALEIVTPALALVETVSKDSIKSMQSSKVRAFFEHEYVFVVGVDTEIADRARELIQQPVPRDVPWLRGADATYVATASIMNIPELHAYDRPLSTLSNRYKTSNGGLIRICEPEPSAASAPLLEAGE